jgi:hypothetical protein
MGRYMLEGEAWVPKRVEQVFLVEMLTGLRRVASKASLDISFRDRSVKSAFKAR